MDALLKSLNATQQTVTGAASSWMAVMDTVADKCIDLADDLVARAAGQQPKHNSSNVILSFLRTALRCTLRFGAASTCAGAASWLFCRFRLYPGSICYRVHFGATMVTGFGACFLSVLPVVALSKVGLVCHERVAKYTLTSAWLAVQWIRSMNPQLRENWVTGLDQDQQGSDGSRSVLRECKFSDIEGGAVLNCSHASQWDGFCLTNHMPLATFMHAKYMGKAELANLPILGYLLFECAQYFRVFYKADVKKDGVDAAYDNWKLDNEKQAKEMQRVQEFLAKDGLFVFATEGRINLVDPAVIQSPRFGMLAILFETGRPIYTLTIWNAHSFWSGHDLLGGVPTQTSLSFSKYCFPKAADLPQDDKGKVSAQALAEHLQKFMQMQLDHVRADHKARFGTKM